MKHKYINDIFLIILHISGYVGAYKNQYDECGDFFFLFKNFLAIATPKINFVSQFFLFLTLPLEK